VTFSSGSATGLAICKGAWLGRPDEAWKHKCARWAQCPSCERKRAAKRAHEIKERIKVAMHEYGNELQVGVLTVTLPGVKHESGIRYASLKEQYDYAIARTTLPGLPGYHSMRGMNRLLCGKPDHKGFGRNAINDGLGAVGGTHFMEFTYNNTKSWWNVHMHSLFYGPEKLDRLKETTRHVVEDDQLLLKKLVGGRQCAALAKLGYGKRYSLDYCEADELDNIIRYSSKVAYVTKPFKAPKHKAHEIEEFMLTNPRLSRPFGRNQFSMPSLPDGYGEEKVLEDR
jgi:hypothetical protein